MKINKLVNSYHAKTERNKSIKLLKKKDDIISRLEKMISDQNIRSDISLKNNEKMISNQVNKLSKIVGYTESIAKDVRLKTTRENYHQIFVYKIFDHDNGALFYKCYRLHSKSVGIINSDKKKNRNLRFICIFSDDCILRANCAKVLTQYKRG